MLGLLRSSRRRRSWAWHAATAIAILAQCWIAAAPLGEGRGFGAAAHVEAAGISQHYAHDAADCASCAVLALPALAASPHSFPPLRLEAPRTAIARTQSVEDAAPPPLSRPRAPPVSA